MNLIESIKSYLSDSKLSKINKLLRTTTPTNDQYLKLGLEHSEFNFTGVVESNGITDTITSNKYTLVTSRALNYTFIVQETRTSTDLITDDKCYYRSVYELRSHTVKKIFTIPNFVAKIIAEVGSKGCVLINGWTNEDSPTYGCYITNINDASQLWWFTRSSKFINLLAPGTILRDKQSDSDRLSRVCAFTFVDSPGYSPDRKIIDYTYCDGENIVNGYFYAEECQIPHISIDLIDYTVKNKLAGLTFDQIVVKRLQMFRGVDLPGLYY